MQKLDESQITNKPLWHLMQDMGIESAKSLAMKIYNLIDWQGKPGDKNADRNSDEYDAYKKHIDSLAKKIIVSLYDSKMDAELLKAYCSYFGCSADYLLGFIPLRTHNDTNIAADTGLSESSVNILKRWHQDQEMSNVSGFNLFYGNEIECLNALLEHEWKRPNKGIAKTFFFWVWLYLCSTSCRKASSKTVRYKYNDKNDILKTGDSINGNVISEYSIHYDKFTSVKIDETDKVAFEDTANNKMYQVDVSGLMETYTLQEITKSLQELKSEH